ncbi:MAG TPA: cytochrome c, partial [Bryobacteraceae bacterium]|nr:cytochrome c [Bryobacteraceae bacterium]
TAIAAFLCFSLTASLRAAEARGGSGPTFARDVWPVLERRCVSCHQPGAVAPMAFTSYSEVRPWARAIREAVASRSMPPWHAAPGSAHAFRNDRALSKAEIDTIVRWADAGSPEGDQAPPKFVAASDHGWRLGKPDLVLQVPGLHVPKSGVVPYTFLIVPLHFDHDTWVRAAEFRIDQRQLVHHINAFVRPPDSSYLADFPRNEIFVPTLADRGKKREGEAVFARRQLLLGYEPGYEPMPWLENGAKLIKAGSDIVFEMHFNPNGHEATDRSELGLYFAKAAPAKRVLAIDTLRDLDLRIPPQSSSYLSNASMTLGQPARLLSIQPHMHVRGKSMEVKAIFPDGRSEVLLSVPKYDFNWQTTYVLRDPLNLPAGTVLESIAGFDNSANNAFNPDPNATVRWGDQTFDEMHIAFLELVIDASADPESLLKTPPRMVGQPR